ncbi:hypothetical protein [Negadavirga shengliensis]|uniref:Uncharacterized protein n=1 Tax=Negadavirga shengliensis TaxID=1389218 RepID=A0ABV9T724_9BACT
MMDQVYKLILIVFIAVLPKVSAQEVTFETKHLKIALDERGHIESLFDRVHKKEYLLSGQASPFLTLRVGENMVQPERLQVSGDQMSLFFPVENIEARIEFREHEEYLTFELTGITSPDLVEVVIWGPYPTSVREIIGEAVGVVRNGEFAIGIQALNVKTLGGYPSQESDIEPAYDIFETGDLVDVDSGWRNKKYYRGQTAKVIENGSVLQAYTRNRSDNRVIENWGHSQYLAPAFEDGGVVGSKIALFGCPSDQALTTIGTIEVAEGLPHPTINGAWAKTAKEATASYLIMGFDGKSLDKAVSLTKKAGLKYLYHGGPFKTWGHFELNQEAFPDNWKSLKSYVDRAAAEGVHLGLHTLSNFITTNDPYVTPVPDPRLAIVGESTLEKPIDASAKEIPIASPVFFNQMENNSLHAARIGNEIVRYRAVSEEVPWRLLDCIRGAYGTQASTHLEGEAIGKLMDHGYKVFLSNAELSEEIALTLARLFNETGLMQISFDGLEGVWSTGMGQYARSLFTKTWYDHLSPELRSKIINDASNPSHFNWHINTRYNWGEPWYAGFRESQTNYRLMNQDFYKRNLLPAMLGWFSMSDQTSLEDTEWLLARAAGFDAGFAFNVSFAAVDKNGISDEIFEAIRTWEAARMAGVFSDEQKTLMQDIENEYHLEAKGEGEWVLYSYKVGRHEHKQLIRQPGEPVHSVMEFGNPYSEQPMQFLLKLNGGENNAGAAASNLTMEVNNFHSLEIPFAIHAGQYLKLDASGIMRLYDASWNVLQEANIGDRVPKLKNGNNRLIIDSDFSGNGNASIHVELKASVKSSVK